MLFQMRDSASGDSLWAVLFQRLLLFSGLSLLFLIPSAYFARFNGDWPLYASEALCSHTTRINTCGQTGKWPDNPFRGDVGKIEQVITFGVYYPSYTFTRAYGLFLSPTDSLTSAIAKIHIFKSLVAASLTFAVLHLLRVFPSSRPFALKASLVAFAFPYLLFTSASVYPSPIASIGLLLTLVCTKVMSEVMELGASQYVLLATLFLTSSAIVMTNRLETAVFCGVAITLAVLRFWGRRRIRRRLMYCFASYVFLFGILAAQNTALNRQLFELVQLRLRVVSPTAAESSVIVSQIGDTGYSLLALVTFIDNSTRNLHSAINNGGSSPGWWVNLLLALSWSPLLVIMTRHLVGLIQSPATGQMKRFATLARNWPSFVCLALFFLIPFIYQSIWFFHYAVPLMMVSLFFDEQNRLGHKLTRVLLMTGICSNLLTFLSVAKTANTVRFQNASIESQWLVLTGVIAGFLVVGTAGYTAKERPRDRL